jgi:repressor LexA
MYLVEQMFAERRVSMALSPRQEQMLGFIRRFTRDHGFPPTIREIGEEVGISSTSVVNYNLDALERKKRILRDRRVSRGLRLIEGAEVISIPLVGRIAAGEPVPIPETSVDFALFDETVEIASTLLGDTEGIYALEVSGESMIDALINDGDIVLMKHQQHANNGDMVAALLVDTNETTLKRFYREGKQVRLQPENPFMDPIYAPADGVQIQGKVMMVIRRLN